MASSKKNRVPRPTTRIDSPVLGGRVPSLSSLQTAAGRRDIEEPATSVVHGRSASPPGTSAGDLESAVTDAVRTVQSVLPNRLPVLLGLSALLVAGVLEAPVALAGGLAYEALRRWRPDGRRSS